MQIIHFETTVKNGHIKLPERYERFNNKRVMVDIINKETPSEEKKERVKNMENFLQNCSGILKDLGIPTDLTTKDIREMRLNEKYGL